MQTIVIFFAQITCKAWLFSKGPSFEIFKSKWEAWKQNGNVYENSTVGNMF